MKYEVSIFYDDAEVNVKTDNPEIAIMELMKADAKGVHAHVCDGYTGEVLAIVNHPQQFATPEFSLMVMGFLFKMEQEAAEEEEFECVDCESEEEEECLSAEDMVLNLIQALGGLSG